MQPLQRLYHTVRSLKWSQIWYRMIKPTQKRYSSIREAKPEDIAGAMQLPIGTLMSLPAYKRYEPRGRTFTFLNKCVAFPQAIDWNYKGEGALWAYNLNYFEWLYDDDIRHEARFETIKDYVKSKPNIGLDPFPTSLRIVAWTRFLLRYGYRDREVFSQLFQHTNLLYSMPEYHIDGNHLWENAVAIVCGGVFFRNEAIYNKGKLLMKACLVEQVYKDGGHIEGSPMYHSLLLWRLLQCIELLGSIGKKDELKGMLEEQACKMLGWINNITFSDGSWPAVNDCAEGIAPTTDELVDYAMQLGLRRKREELSDSCYRMIQCGGFELFIDAADIRPVYQPGHAHADIGTFCLHYNGKPVIVDPGVSTYEDCAQRHWQRSTKAHNTITIDGANSSDVWKSFRVGQRAKRIALTETGNMLTISYSGYADLNLIHKRTFAWSEKEIKITDEIIGDIREREVALRLHFHPENKIRQIEGNNIRTDYVLIHHEGLSVIQRLGYEFCKGFNITLQSESIKGKLQTNQYKSRIIISAAEESDYINKNIQ